MAPLLNIALLECPFRTRNSNFRRNAHNDGINPRNLKGPLKGSLINAFIKLHCYLTKGFDGGARTNLRTVIFRQIEPPLTRLA